jgi:hypothetical protein
METDQCCLGRGRKRIWETAKGCEFVRGGNKIVLELVVVIDVRFCEC